MSFLAPAFLLGLLALALPVLLHLLRRRVVRTVPFPALRFLAPNRADQNRQKIRRRLVLALRCLALALLAAAFARPFFGAPPAVAGRATIVVVDPSFSLRTGQRWPELLRWTREQIGGGSAGESIGVLLARATPSWRVPPGAEAAVAVASLETLGPGWQSCRVEPALRLAGDLLAASPAAKRRIIFLGDHQALSWAGTDFTRPLPPGVEVIFPPVPEAPLRQAALRSPALAREGDAWILTLAAHNFTTPQARTVSVFAENSPNALLSSPWELPSGDDSTLRLTLPPGPTPPAWLRVSLDADDLPADDSAWIICPAPVEARQPLLLDRAPGPDATDHLAIAFAAMADLPPSFRVLPPPANTPWPLPALAVLRHDASFTDGPAAWLDAFLAAGGSALIFLDDGPARLRWLARHGIVPRPVAEAPARLRDWTPDHPLVVPLAADGLRGLVGWEFSRAWSLPADACDPIACWSDATPALGEFAVGAGRVLLAGWPPGREVGDWPLRPAFVPFLHRAATHLLGLTAATAESAPRVGLALALPAPSGSWHPLAGPAVESKPQVVNDPVRPDAPGVYEFTAPGAPRRLYAVGLAPEESDPAPGPADQPWTALASTATPAPPSPSARLHAYGAEVERPNPLWWWAFAGLGVFALAELGLANRTAR